MTYLKLNHQMEQFAQDGCKVVYLHVLATNITARRFYEKRNFRQHMIIPYYYTIGKGVLSPFTLETFDFHILVNKMKLI